MEVHEVIWSTPYVGLRVFGELEEYNMARGGGS